MKEVWKDIKGESPYQVSTKGKVRDKVTGQYINQGDTYHGYKYVMINCKQKYVHRLVGKAFILNPDKKPQINHKNHIRNDNRIENLEWVTFTENIKKAWEFGRFNKNVVGENHFNTKLNEEKVIEIKKSLRKGVKGVELAEKHNVSNATITGIRNGRVWSHVTI